jgi:V/A-type H+/Na+-transporting ATPase subunit E
MSSSSPLEGTIDKVLAQKESELLSKIESGYQESLGNLDSSRSKLLSEYLTIIENARKQAENLKRQIIGSNRLSARNNQLILIEDAVKNVLEMVKEKLAAINKDPNYEQLMEQAILDSVKEIGRPELIIECNKNDVKLVRRLVENIGKEKGSKIIVSDKQLEVLGGIRARSSDGALTYDDTIDSRIERLKPLIRKNIVQILKGDK